MPDREEIQSFFTLPNVLQAGTVALLGWILMSVHSLSTDMAVVKATIESLKVDRYTATQAEAQKILIEDKIDRLEKWNNRLSDRLHAVEETLMNEKQNP